MLLCNISRVEAQIFDGFAVANDQEDRNPKLNSNNEPLDRLRVLCFGTSSIDPTAVPHPVMDEGIQGL